MKISAFHEKELHIRASSNVNIKYLNISLLGLRGRHHPALSNLLTTHDVQKSIPHIKMLCNDYFTYENSANQSCFNAEKQINKVEDITHIIAICNSYTDIRERIIEEFSSLCKQSKSKVDFKNILMDKETLCQFIPSNMNLKSCVNIKDELLPEFFKLSLDICYSIHTKRMKILQQMQKKK